MSRFPDKPPGTVIQEREEIDGITLFWVPVSALRWPRYFIAAFLIFWLCAWAIGWVMVFGQLMMGGFHGFLLFWLCGWTLGGVFAGVMVWALLRPARPESVTLRPDSLRYDPGNSLFVLPTDAAGRWSGYPRHQLHANLFRRRKPVELVRSDAKPFVLERVGERQRLTFDLGADRMEIGAGLREPEREWLHGMLESWRLA